MYTEKTSLREQAPSRFLFLRARKWRMKQEPLNGVCSGERLPKQ